MKILLLILLGLLIISYKSRYSIEKFLVSPFNSIKVNENILDIHKKTEDEKQDYISRIKNLWKDNQYQIINDNKLSSNDFPFKNLFEEIVKDNLNNMIKSTKIDVSEIEEFGKYKDLFNFDINLINRTQLWIIPVKVWIRINCENCLSDILQQTQNNVISIEQITSLFKLEFISIDDLNLKKYNVKANEYIPDYYQIKNTLYLMDPFLTSGDEMRLKNIDTK